MRSELYFLLLLFLLNGCGERIVHDIDEGKANRIVIALSQQGIEAEKVREGPVWSVKVASQEVTRALQKLEESRLLVSEAGSATQSSSSFIQNAEERRLFLGSRISKDVEETLERVPRILEAHVHLNLESAKTLLSKPTSQGTASVLIVSEAPEEVITSSIQQIVAGAAGLEARKISVVKVLRRAPFKESRPANIQDNMEYPALATLLMFAGPLIGVIVLAVCFFSSKRQRTDVLSALRVEKA